MSASSSPSPPEISRGELEAAARTLLGLAQYRRTPKRQRAATRAAAQAKPPESETYFSRYVKLLQEWARLGGLLTPALSLGPN